MEKASGQSVKLDCQFTLAPEDSGPLDIEWILMASDNQQEDKVVRSQPMPETIFWFSAYMITFLQNKRLFLNLCLV